LVVCVVGLAREVRSVVVVCGFGWSLFMSLF
jgi:hypothetical protein